LNKKLKVDNIDIKDKEKRDKKLDELQDEVLKTLDYMIEKSINFVSDQDKKDIMRLAEVLLSSHFVAIGEKAPDLQITLHKS